MVLDEKKGANVDSLSDRVIEDGNEGPFLSIKTNVDPKDVFENNPYFDKNKTYSEEELEKFRKFFGG